MMPTAASIVESIVPMMRMRSTLMPVAAAKRGFAPAALIAIPVLERMNSHTTRQQAAKNSSNPVGIVTPTISKERKSLSTWR